MIVSGVTAQDIRDVVAKLNATDYDGNVVIERLDTLNQKGTRHTLKLGTADSRKHGSRRAGSGRHGKWLCWHGFRDVVRAIMAVNPDAKVRSMKAVYDGSVGFERVYPSTAETNIGSLYQPAYMPDMCVGSCAGDWE